MKAVRNFFSFVGEQIREAPSVAIITLIYILFCWGSGIYFFIGVSAYNGALAFFISLVALLVYVLEYNIGIRIGPIFAVFLYIDCTSNILGSGYGLYTALAPYFDKIMHTLAGVVFTAVGYTFCKLAVKEDKGAKFAACIIGAFCVCMACAVVWEMFEYFNTAVLHNDLQSNYTLQHIIINIEGEGEAYREVTQTIITWADGSETVLDGYIDLGLYDTLQDMLVCICGSIVVMVLCIIDRCCWKDTFMRLFVPRLIPRERKGKKGSAPDGDASPEPSDGFGEGDRDMSSRAVTPGEDAPGHLTDTEMISPGPLAGGDGAA